ncbi:hypothetical protein cce_1906 [Crocosphaera subtropica ATCC 51142]|uniref:DUF86 domain-containing protein n=1 Tax=Crocosphaera subtropica (strain ATCC 51142 / BH68) TaxID=43989 RepID=B1X0G7_CROS5|nr:DUF86 domain-containing protein [Crocosphaera subtropica]ACB51256.1 hypothetical protein cce_1906 [Crocosphaera subtropica ATCC 51142]
MRDDKIRLQDILDAIEQIETYITYIKEGKETSYDSKLLQSGVLYQLIIIGEAAGDIDISFRNQYPNIPWKKIIGMRSILADQYFRIDLDVVWSTVSEHLPSLKKTVQ